MTVVTVVAADGSWMPLTITATAGPTLPTNTLHEHTVRIGTDPATQVVLKIMPGAIESPPVPISPPVIT